MVFVAGAAVAAVGAGVSAYGASKQSSAAKSAAGMQDRAAREAANREERQYWQSREDQAPWMREGQWALGELRPLADKARSEFTWQAPNQPLRSADYAWQPPSTVEPSGYGYRGPGVPDPTQGRFDPSQHGYNGPAMTDPNQYRFDPSGYRLNAGDSAYNPRQALDPSQYRYTPGSTEGLGAFTFKPPDVTDDPGYQFRLRQGQEALDASAAARGGLGSGAQQKALLEYGQDLGSQEYQAAYGRSWQQQQEQYERQRLMNMTDEERRQYAESSQLLA